MVLKDPTYIQSDLTGLYVWQSGKEGFPEVEDHKIFDGVQISPLDKVINDYGIGNVYVRKLILNTPLDIKLLTEIHHEIHHHKYDRNIMDWLMAGIYEVENWTEIDKMTRKFY